MQSNELINCLIDCLDNLMTQSLSWETKVSSSNPEIPRTVCELFGQIPSFVPIWAKLILSKPSQSIYLIPFLY